MKVYSFIKENEKEIYYSKIEKLCNNLKGNNLKNYFIGNGNIVKFLILLGLIMIKLKSE